MQSRETELFQDQINISCLKWVFFEWVNQGKHVKIIGSRIRNDIWGSAGGSWQVSDHLWWESLSGQDTSSDETLYMTGRNRFINNFQSETKSKLEAKVLQGSWKNWMALPQGQYSYHSDICSLNRLCLLRFKRFELGYLLHFALLDKRAPVASVFLKQHNLLSLLYL